MFALLSPALPQAVAAPGVAQPSIVSDNPANWTPNVLNGQVNALVQVGNRIIAGGIFTQVQAAGSTGPILTRTNMFAFDATTGAIDTGFAPVFDDEVTAIAASPDNQSLYVGGAFSTINGATARSIGKINAVTGAKDATYRGGANGRVNDLALSNGRLIIGGQFTTVKTVTRNDIASLDPTTGDVTAAIPNSFTGIHNPTARGGAQKSAITKFAVDPAGNKLVAIGNFTLVDGVARDQVAMLDISTSPSTLANWYTTQYTSKCSNTFTTYMRDLDISPDGSYVVISTTGAYGGSTSGCDVISRYEMGAVGTNLQSTWRNYTGGDTTYAVAITGTAVYVGGHFRWLNNAFAADTAGTGAVPREGIAALDPSNGLPFSWNPGRERGVGVFDILATSAGIWIGDDTDRVASELRQRLAFFPLSTGTTPPPNMTGTLPTDVYALGGSDPSVLYRVNAGGPELPSADDGPNWLADTAASPSPLHTTGGTATTYTDQCDLGRCHRAEHRGGQASDHLVQRDPQRPERDTRHAVEHPGPHRHADHRAALLRQPHWRHADAQRQHRRERDRQAHQLHCAHHPDDAFLRRHQRRHRQHQLLAHQHRPAGQWHRDPEPQPDCDRGGNGCPGPQPGF